ncbi:MAG TPA: FecR domain-containing protein [Caulobacteraceae bacterium]
MSIDAKARELLLDGDERATDAWRAADPANETAFRDAQVTWSAIGRTRFAREEGWRRDVRPGRGRWLVPGAAIAASLAIAAVIAPQVLNRPDQAVRTAIAQTGALDLAPGATVFVGALSRVELNDGAATLKDGEAFFDAPGHALTVYAKDAVIRSSGARFNVRCTPDGLQIAVLEGKVQVLKRAWPLAQPAPTADLTAGQQLRLEDGAAATAAFSSDPAGWRNGRLLYADAPLKDVVADANRYSNHPIRLASSDIGELRVTASFRTRAVDELIASLDAGLPIRATREPDGDILLEAQTAPN